MSLLQRTFILILVLLLVVVAGLSLALYHIQERHGQTIAAESLAVQRLEITDRAALRLAEQREAVTASLFAPFDRHDFARDSALFQHLMSTSFLAYTPEGHQLQAAILRDHRRFSQAALRLPAHPTPAQVRIPHTMGDALAAELRDFRTRHTVDLSALQTSEEQARRLSLLMIIVSNSIIFLMALGGLILLDRLSLQESRAATLRTTDKLRREFVAFAAHELRNPASAIQTGVSVLRDPELDPDIQRQVIDSIARSADALLRLVSNLLAMGRTEEGRLQLRRTPTNIAALFDDQLSELAVYHAGIDKRVQRTLPNAVVDIDPEYIGLVIANIVDNAVKYSPPRSPITVSGKVTDHWLTVHIHNSGAGIPPDTLPAIFEMYETTGNAPYSLRRGVGLGLYMARLLIDAHGGTIWAESRPGEGATFSFTLPLVAHPSAKTA